MAGRNIAAVFISAVLQSVRAASSESSRTTVSYMILTWDVVVLQQTFRVPWLLRAFWVPTRISGRFRGHGTDPAAGSYVG